jgi:hypothetical protein
MEELADEFQSLVEQTSIATPNINLLRGYVDQTESVQPTV